MNLEHTALEELFAAEALGGLDDAGRAELDRALEGHGGECTVCRGLRADYREVAARLALVAGDQATIEGAVEPPAPSPTEPTTGLAKVLPLRPGLPRPSRGLRGVAAVAAVVLLVAAGLSGYLLAPDRGPEVSLATLMARPDARVVRFDPDGGTGDLALAFAPGTGRSFLLGSGLADPPGDDVYQLWMIAEGVPVSAGIFSPDDGRVLVEVPADPGGADVVAVTFEPPGGSEQPSGAPIFVAPIEPPVAQP